MSKITDRQRAIIGFMRTRPENTVKLIEVVNEFKHWYYANGRKHVSDIMFRMYKSGKVTRPKHGHYKLRDVFPAGVNESEIVDENQLNIFDVGA